MLKVYVNYPNPHVSIHAGPTCGAIQMTRKPVQRLMPIDRGTLSDELTRFADKTYTFACSREHNDMWLEVEFGDASFETAVVHYIKNLLGQHYQPLNRAVIERHC
jgi:hypothetical protein